MKEQKIENIKWVARISGAFSIIVAILLIVNYIQIKSHSPVENKALESIVAQLKNDPNNHDLMEAVRNLDLIARKAWFTAQWQLNTGALLLIIGSIVCFGSLRWLSKHFAIIGEPEEKTTTGDTQKQTQRAINIGALLLILAALWGVMGSKTYFDTYKNTPAMLAVADTIVQEQPKVEVITVTNADSATNTTAKSDTVILAEPVAKVAEPRFATFADFKMQHATFRGPWGQGVSYAKNTPTDWDVASGKNIAWKTVLPLHGFNSPIIWDSKIFVAGADAKKRSLFCIDKNSGKILWQKEIEKAAGSPASPPKVTDDTGLSAPTLATDGQRVYAIFATGDLAAYTVNGEPLWTINIGVPTNHYGHSSSLQLLENKLYVQYDTGKGGKLLAFNVLNGEKLWETVRAVKISWSSPILAKINNTVQLVLTADPLVAGYDAESGKELWKIASLSGEVGPSAAYANGKVFAVNEYAKFAAINPTNGTASELWESSEYLAEVSSPLAADNWVIVATSYGMAACYDQTNGEKLWENDFGEGFYSSPILADGKIYLADMGGTMHIMKAGNNFELIAEHDMGGKVFTTPAFADGFMCIKAGNTLFGIKK